mgnify:CR=1 FL=1
MYQEKYDAIVVGSGPGGFTAALAAAREGMKVLVIERNPFLGGLLASGLPPVAFLDRSGHQVVKGIAEEFVRRLRDVGGATQHYPAPIQNSLTYLNMSWARIMVNEMLKEAQVDTIFMPNSPMCLWKAPNTWHPCVQPWRNAGISDPLFDRRNRRCLLRIHGRCRMPQRRGPSAGNFDL